MGRLVRRCRKDWKNSWEQVVRQPGDEQQQCVTCTPVARCWSRQKKEVVLSEPTARDAQQDLGITEFEETLWKLETQQRQSHQSNTGSRNREGEITRLLPSCSHLPISPRCFPLANSNRNPVGQGAWEM